MFFFFFNDTAPTEISPLSLPDALPISRARSGARPAERSRGRADRDDSDGIRGGQRGPLAGARDSRSEEHTSELQSQSNLVCRLLLGKKNKTGVYRGSLG